MTRTVLHLVHKHVDRRWHLEQIGKDLGSFETKEQAEEEGKRRGNELGARGRDAQLVIHRQDGSIETEWTYGHDARGTPG